MDNPTGAWRVQHSYATYTNSNKIELNQKVFDEIVILLKKRHAK
jgi:hypothetical protein